MKDLKNIKEYMHTFEDFSRPFFGENIHLLAFFYDGCGRLIRVWYTTIDLIRKSDDVRTLRVIYSRFVDFQKSLGDLDADPPVEKCLEIGLQRL